MSDLGRGAPRLSSYDADTSFSALGVSGVARNIDASSLIAACLSDACVFMTAIHQPTGGRPKTSSPGEEHGFFDLVRRLVTGKVPMMPQKRISDPFEFSGFIKSVGLHSLDLLMVTATTRYRQAWPATDLQEHRQGAGGSMLR